MTPLQQWFAIRVKSGAEKLVASAGHNKGFEEFLPLYKSRRRWSDRVKWLDVPLFPGYVFFRLNPERRLPLLTIPGVMHFVGIANAPMPIDEAEMLALQAAVQSGLSAEPCPFLEVGERVRLEDGPLAGVEGILTEIRNQHRLVVSITLLRRSIAVEIDADWAEPVDARRRTPIISFCPVRA